MKKEQDYIEKAIKLGIKCVNVFPNDFIISSIYLYLLEKDLIKAYGNIDLKKIAEEKVSYNDEKTIKDYKTFLSTLSLEQIREVIYTIIFQNDLVDNGQIEHTNDNLSELVIKLLNFSNNDTVLDLGSGDGCFISNVYKYALKNNIQLNDLIGVEIYTDHVYLSNMCLQIINCNDTCPHVDFKNALKDFNYEYTHGYVFPPFGSKFSGSEKSVKTKYNEINFTSRNSSEWLFIDKLLKGFKTRAIALVPTRVLYNDADKEYRNQIIRDGLLEGIIELPPSAVDPYFIKTCLLIFSKGNKNVKLFNASRDYHNIIGHKCILKNDEIISFYNSDKIETKTNEEAIECNNLTPSIALLNDIQPKNGIELNKLAKVFAGAQYTISKFKEDITEDKTGYKILTSNDIEDGAVDWDNLRNINLNYNYLDKYVVHKNDIILTIKTTKVKIAVVDIEPKEKIVVTGGMLIIRPNTELLNPTFLKIYLDSKPGQKVLRSIQKGAVIMTINIKDLSDILIPSVNIEKQEEKAKLYNFKLSTLLAYKKEIKKIENNLLNFYLDEFGE